jgi:hypothetical protein
MAVLVSCIICFSRVATYHAAELQFIPFTRVDNAKSPYLSGYSVHPPIIRLIVSGMLSLYIRDYEKEENQGNRRKELNSKENEANSCTGFVASHV